MFFTAGAPPPPFPAEIVRLSFSFVADVGASLHAASRMQHAAAIITLISSSLDTGECTYPVLR